ncbi:hypothetical protein [Acinetobacter pittii]|uniref:hypothetical protein n=1 Tax=Acinetobacter pittii TaxID=48296 RepID=UPI001F1EE581|nr:hypothetical protein [Acinetobacter pittii]MCE6237779.1 hypothetical protein [Acinetobacter pittii]MCE6692636.1 hypothetical protein [Acinetobacter pittii]MCE6700056.1 hypothetical protein [Acinetobacter pittii]MCU4527710.1 hypothetical protein [Acinetobacter pittii]
MKRYITISILLSFSTFSHSLEVYQYIIWNQYIDQTGKLISGNKKFQNFLAMNKLKPIRVIYHDKFLTHGRPDPQKIKMIADVSKKYPHIPISFDIEIGNKFKPQTILPIVNQTLDLYHQYEGAAPVGVFAVLPQTVFGSESMDQMTKKKYLKLNQKYEEIAKKVDFLSPVIYNNWFRDFGEWRKRTDHQLSESKKYASKYNLKVIPYFSSSYLDKDFFKNHIIYSLTEQEMKQRLDYINSKNVDGIIIWDSSIGVLSNGEKPTFDINKGAAKAIIDFAKK